MDSLHHRLSLLVAAALALLVSTPGAHADDAWKFQWSNGFKLENKDQGHSLKFGGRIMADYTFADSDDYALTDGFEFRRARLFFSGKVYDRVTFKAQYDWAGGEAAVKDLYVGIDNSWGEIKFGHFHEQFSLEEVTSSKYIAFLERSLPTEAFAPSRNAGVGVIGAGSDKLNWGFGVFYDTDDFGESIHENDVNVTGRVGFNPVFADDGAKVVHVGFGASLKERDASLRFRSRPEAHNTGRLIDTGNFAADSATLLNLELATVQGPFWAAAEYTRADVDAPAVGDPTFDGFYVQVGWFLTGEHRVYKGAEGVFERTKPTHNFGKGHGAWEIAARYSNLDLDDAGIHGGEEDNVTVGVNWYLNPVARLMMDYVKADVKDAGEADFFLVRWQIDF